MTDIIVHQVNIAHYRLVELSKLADHAKPFYDWVEKIARQITGHSKTLSEILLPVDRPQLKQIIQACYSNEHEEKPLLFDGVAPDIHQFFRSLKVGDIVYIKTFHPVPGDTIIKAVGLIADGEIVDKSPSDEIDVSIGRKVLWLSTEEFVVPPLADWKNNVRQNALYEEFHPVVQKLVLNHLSN